MSEEKRVAIVTGSSSGIGESVARTLAARGIRVVVNSARSRDAGERIAAQLPDALYLQADIADEQQATRLVVDTLERFGRLDILVNNAGTTRFIPHQDLDAATGDVWREILGVNVIGTWQTTVAAVPALRESGSGAIVNISSVAGQRPAGSSIPYAVSKAAVSHLTRLLAKTLGPAIRVNAVAPGLIDTPWTAGQSGFAEIAEHVRAGTPLRRVGTPEDVAHVVAALVDAEYLTGEVVHVDGGAQLI